MHIPHRSCGLVSLYVVFGLALVSQSWAVQTFERALVIDRTPETVRSRRNEDFQTESQCLVYKIQKKSKRSDFKFSTVVRITHTTSGFCL